MIPGGVPNRVTAADVVADLRHLVQKWNTPDRALIVDDSATVRRS